VKGQFNNNAFKPNEFATFNEMAKLEQKPRQLIANFQTLVSLQTSLSCIN
jgi:hypothetical protein